MLRSGVTFALNLDTEENGMSKVTPAGLPEAQGLYNPGHEHDACGVGFVVDMKGRRSHAIVAQALEVLKNLLHRGACGCEVNTGDGAGILIQIPHAFLTRECARLGITASWIGIARSRSSWAIVRSVTMRGAVRPLANPSSRISRLAAMNVG